MPLMHLLTLMSCISGSVHPWHRIQGWRTSVLCWTQQRCSAGAVLAYVSTDLWQTSFAHRLTRSLRAAGAAGADAAAALPAVPLKPTAITWMPGRITEALVAAAVPDVAERAVRLSESPPMLPFHMT